MTEAEATAVEDAARQLKTLSETFRELEYEQIVPCVACILMRLSAVDAVLATRAFGLRVPNTRKACIEGISRAIAERRESWQRCQSIGLSDEPAAGDGSLKGVSTDASSQQTVVKNATSTARRYVSTAKYNRQNRAPGFREGTGRKPAR